MRFKTIHGDIYLPADIIIHLIESGGPDKSYIRTDRFVMLVDHSLDETINIVKTARSRYLQTGEL